VASPLLRIAFRSVRKNWRHSMGAGLAVAVGFAAITLFAGYLSDFEATVRHVTEERMMLGTVVVEGTGASAALSGAAERIYLGGAEQSFIDDYLRGRGGEVAVRVRSLFVGGIASNGRASTPFLGWGYDPQEGAALRQRFAWDAWSGRPLHEAGGDSVLLANALAALLECAPRGDASPFGPDGLLIAGERPFECRNPRVQLIGSTGTGQVNAVEPRVAGFFDGGRKELDAQMIMMPLALAQRFRNAPDVSIYSVLLREPSRAEEFARALTAAARARGLAIDAMPWEASYYGVQFRQGMGLLRAFRSLLTLVVVALAGMAVFSTMVKAVSERTREIGTLRSLGFVRGQVTRLFILEASFLSASACGVGLLLTLAGAALVGGAGITYTGGLMSTPLPLGVALDPATWLTVALFLVGIAVFAAWLPARRAARSRIPDALAYA